MAIADVNAIVKAYLDTAITLTALVSDRIYSPRIPENGTLPAVSFFVRGGIPDEYVPGLLSPSFQFDCWANNPIDARKVYRKLYDNLQGKQNIVTGTTQGIISAIEEVSGYDVVDVDVPNYFRVITFFTIMIRAE